MRNLLFVCVVCAFCAGSAFGQSGLVGNVMSAQPQMFTMPEHPQHASQTGLAEEKSLLEQTQVTWGHGERPLWELMPPPAFVSLGAIARAYREQHATAKRASIVWKNY
ncbi:MAG TPA: hypothetical protein VJO35_05510 [Terriglobales bacterium]|nr:hypothetical protein [Terriglobales bacterium]